MLKQVEGSVSTAEAIALCRPEIISAYPITPQTHIVEGLGRMVKKGALKNCDFLNVESEFGAMSACIGSSLAGARTYTATASQGLLFMMEAVYNASGLGLPIVMTLGVRCIGAPINIWNDHSDAMSVRDAGWIQLFAENNQEAADLHIQAFKLAEAISLPVMVCMDGFILTHAVERVDIPTQEQVDEFLPPFVPVQTVDPKHPMSIGSMVGPEAFTELKVLQNCKYEEAMKLIPAIGADFKEKFGRDTGGLFRTYRTEDADFVVVALGSVNGTIKDTIDELRDEEGLKIGLVTIVSYRPLPKAALREALKPFKQVVVVDRAFSFAQGGYVMADIENTLIGLPHEPQVLSLIAGLGGRAITRKSLKEAFRRVKKDPWSGMLFLDLDQKIVDAELDHMNNVRQYGPLAENVVQRVKNTPAAE